MKLNNGTVINVESVTFTKMSIANSFMKLNGFKSGKF